MAQLAKHSMNVLSLTLTYNITVHTPFNDCAIIWFEQNSLRRKGLICSLNYSGAEIQGFRNMATQSNESYQKIFEPINCDHIVKGSSKVSTDFGAEVTSVPR